MTVSWSIGRAEANVVAAIGVQVDNRWSKNEYEGNQRGEGGLPAPMGAPKVLYALLLRTHKRQLTGM